MRADEYAPLDVKLASYDHNVAEIRVDGDLRAYVACVIKGRAGLRGRGELRPSLRVPVARRTASAVRSRKTAADSVNPRSPSN